MMNPSPSGRAWATYAVALIAAMFLLAGMFRINDLSLYSPDSVRYVIWGNSVAHGNGITDDTQPDPQRFAEHAPLYSVLIAPVELFFPRSLQAAKAVTVAWGMLSLVLCYVWLRRRLGETAALAGTLLLFCNPLFLVYSSEALTEAPFVAFLLGMLILTERAGEDAPPRRWEWMLLVVLSATIGLLREIGVAASIAAVVFLLMRKKYVRASVLFGAAALCLGAWYLRNQVLVGLPEGSADANSSLVFQHFVTPPEASLLKEFGARIWINAVAYAWQLAGMLFYPLHGSGQVNLALSSADFSHTVRLVIVDLALPLMAAGLYADWRDRQGATFRGMFLLGYLFVVFAYPVHDLRFLFPLLPLMAFYLLKGALLAAAYFPALGRFGQPRYVLALVLLAMLPNIALGAEILSVNASYRSSPVAFARGLMTRPSYPTIYTYPWSVVGGWVRDSVPEGSVIASPSKELSIVVGERKVLEANPGLTVPLFERMIRDNNVTYLLSEVSWEDVQLYEFLMKESNRYRFDSVFGAANLRLYRVTSRLQSPRGEDARRSAAAISADSFSASGALRAGREEFARGEYQAALQHFLLAAERAPGVAEPLYQAVAAASMEGDSAQAQRLYERLIAYPQAASHTYLARTHLEAMRVALSAVGVPPTQERAIRMNDLARLYWDMGYHEKAERLADESLHLDSAYFWGLLWGFHFNQQNGDTADARHYYRQLLALSPDNQVVVSFARILAIEDSLRTVREPAVRSSLHLSAARIYKLIELYEVALDEGERALAADPGNVAAKQILGETFLAKGVALRENEGVKGSTGPLRQAARYFSQVLALDPGNAFVRAKADTVGMTISDR